MKPTLDLIQNLLPFSWGCIILALLSLLAWKAFWRGWFWIRFFASAIFRELRKWLPNLNPLRGGLWNWLLIWGATLLLQSFAPEISEQVQRFEQTFLNPVYFLTDTSSAVVSAFESKLQSKLGPNEYALFVRRTAEIAQKCGSSPLSFYNVYESECGCNPYAVNVTPKGDTVAAGQIQFTRAGIDGLLLNGQTVTFRQVKDAVRAKRLAWLLDLQEVYMERARRGMILPRPCDVYTAVFIPSGLGGADSQVLAAARSQKPEYYFQNIGLDGYALTTSGKILNLASQRDGKITINDLALCLAYKQAQVVKGWGKN